MLWRFGDCVGVSLPHRCKLSARKARAEQGRFAETGITRRRLPSLNSRFILQIVTFDMWTLVILASEFDRMRFNQKSDHGWTLQEQSEQLIVPTKAFASTFNKVRTN
jgi:hypothetical protein